MNERNARVQARYDELMREGKHGHYETLFKVVNEEVARLEARIREALNCCPPYAHEVREELRKALEG